MCAALLLGGCSTLEYYGQSVRGQMQLVMGARSIDAMIEDPVTDPVLRTRLERVREIRNYAVTDLGLPDNDSYRRYVDLKRDYVVWNVFAAPEFSVQPITWCFPVVGCVAYRGYFSPADARNYAMSLKARGLDVAVGGVAAYSTLGWFDDPLPNTVINRPEAELAGLIFHELAHQVVYISDDTAFNESFATTVELEGTRRWFGHAGNAQRARDFAQDKEREQEVIALLLGARAELKELYQSGLAADAMRQRKQQVFAGLKVDYERLRSGWDGDGRFNVWFARPLNNANLVSVGAYHQYVDAFSQLLARQGGDMQKFYQAVRELGRLPASQRHARLVELQGGG